MRACLLTAAVSTYLQLWCRIAFTPTPEWTLAADVQRILYGDVPAVANPLSNLFLGRPLGSSGGPGFGWRDITVVKVGASYAPSSEWTFRGGYSYSSSRYPRIRLSSTRWRRA